MILLYFLYGLAFEGLGLATYLQLRHEGDFPLKKELPWLAAFGFVGGAAGWVDMFLVSGSLNEIENVLSGLRVVLHLLTGLLILRFGWGMLNNLEPLPAWTIFIPGILMPEGAIFLSARFQNRGRSHHIYPSNQFFIAHIRTICDRRGRYFVDW